MKGTVALYDQNDGLLSNRIYRSVLVRNTIIGEWKRLYAAGFSSCIIQINPSVNITQVNKDGTNAKRVYDRPFAEQGHNMAKNYYGEGVFGPGRKVRKISKVVFSGYGRD